MEDRSEKEEIKETIADLFLKLNNQLNSPQSSSSNCCDHSCVTLNGNNVGAATIIRPSDTEGKPAHHFCISIYVNNNVQGVNNSILLGSSVSMRDPGACLSLSNQPPHNIDAKMGIGDGPRPRLKKRKKKRRPADSGNGVALFCIVILLLVIFICIS